MVAKVIRDYIEGGAKKLTVPGFGTFMRREGGEVIFVDLLRGDDHTLSEMVEDTGRYSELEAMALIDRFIFETKNAIERTGNSVIENFGVMSIDPKGVYQFKYSPKARPVKETAVQEKLQLPVEKPKPTVVSRPAQPRPPVAGLQKRAVAPPRRPQRQKLSRTDAIVVIAIVAAVVAVAVMLFAAGSGNMPFMKK